MFGNVCNMRFDQKITDCMATIIINNFLLMCLDCEHIFLVFWNCGKYNLGFQFEKLSCLRRTLFFIVSGGKT